MQVALLSFPRYEYTWGRYPRRCNKRNLRISNSDNTFGTVINTDLETDNLSIGVSYVDESFFFGISRTVINSEYGLPHRAHNEPSDSPGHSHSHPVGGSIVKQAIVRIDLEQERDMIKFGFDVDHLKFKNFSLILGSIVYDHLEFEADPQTGVPLRGTFTLMILKN